MLAKSTKSVIAIGFAALFALPAAGEDVRISSKSPNVGAVTCYNTTRHENEAAAQATNATDAAKAALADAQQAEQHAQALANAAGQKLGAAEAELKTVQHELTALRVRYETAEGQRQAIEKTCTSQAEELGELRQLVSSLDAENRNLRDVATTKVKSDM